MATPPNPTAAAKPQPSQIQTGPNLVQFDPKQVVPTQPIYLQRNDLLVIFLITNGTGVSVTIDYRWLTPQGEIKEGNVLTGAFTGSFTVFLPLYEGWLLSFSMRALSVIAAGQWVFGLVQLGRGQAIGIPHPIVGVIWQGYIPSSQVSGWPGAVSKEITDGAGTLRSITGTVPGAGADISETVPAQRRWTLLGIRASLTTSAVVANRNVIWSLDDGANVLFHGNSYVNQAASLTFAYSGFNTDVKAGQLSGDNLTILTLPIQLKSGFRIKTSTANLQAADQWTAPQYLVLEWGMWDS